MCPVVLFPRTLGMTSMPLSSAFNCIGSSLSSNAKQLRAKGYGELYGYRCLTFRKKSACTSGSDVLELQAVIPITPMGNMEGLKSARA